MTEWILRYLKETAVLGMEMAPYLMLGFLFAGILYVYFPREKVTRYLGGNNLRSVINAALIGVPLPLCSCGVIPAGISFYKSGSSRGSTVSFLISTPQTGVDSIMATGSLLGWAFAIVRPIVAFLTGILGGLLTNLAFRNENSKPVQKVVDLNGSEEEFHYRNKFFGMLRYAYVDFLQDIAKWLLIGLLLAGLISVLIPDDFFTRYLGNNLVSMLLILLVAVPLYVCATGSIPIAAVLMMKGLSPGAALVFLMAGPATNVATMTVIGKVMGKKVLGMYMVSIIGGALLSGILIDLLLPAQWFIMPLHHLHQAHEHGLPLWLKAGSGIVLLALTLFAIYRRYFRPNKIITTDTIEKKDEAMKELLVKVGGMTCQHCKMNVERTLKAVPGIQVAEVDLSSGNVLLKGDQIDLKAVRDGVESIGYTYEGVL
jgi:uncharacterized membrane protein YraQ (UPF0718 family)/copper chaperone CopZ